jgi:hypothetical protein
MRSKIIFGVIQVVCLMAFNVYGRDFTCELDGGDNAKLTFSEIPSRYNVEVCSDTGLWFDAYTVLKSLPPTTIPENGISKLRCILMHVEKKDCAFNGPSEFDFDCHATESKMSVFVNVQKLNGEDKVFRGLTNHHEGGTYHNDQAWQFRWAFGLSDFIVLPKDGELPKLTRKIKSCAFEN